MHTIAERSNHIDSHTEDMGVREYADVILTPAERYVRREEVYIHAEIPVHQHYALRISGGSGGVHYCGYVIQPYRGILDVLRSERRMSLRESAFPVPVELFKTVAAGKKLAGPGVDCSNEHRKLLEIHFLENWLFCIKDA